MDQTVDPPSVQREEIHQVDDDRFHDGTVCIVTGAASGIGEATALVAAGNGMSVVATDVDGDGLESTVDRSTTLGLDGEVHAVEGDLTVDGDLDRIVHSARDLGDVRFLANIAGLQHISPLESFPMDVYDTMQDVMVRAPMYLSSATLPLIRDAGGGAIGNMSSAHGRYVTTDKAAYNIAKFAIRGLTQSIAAEGDGLVRSFSVSTGYVATPLVTGQLEATAERRDLSIDEVIEEVMLSEATTKEMMDPVDVGNLFIIGFSHLASHLNGGDMLHDGGMTLTYR